MKKKLLFLLSPFCLWMTSCENQPLEHGMAEVNVLLQAGEGIENLAGAEVRLNYITAQNEMSAVIAAGDTVAWRYSATLPANSMSADPFVEVSLGQSVYGYSPSATCFEEGRGYEYSLKLDSAGLSTVDMGASIEGWEEVDMGGGVAAM